MRRGFTNILSGDVQTAAEFYENLLGMRRHFESDWFIILIHEAMNGWEFGILQRDHDVVPTALRAAPAGVIVTFVVDDCDRLHRAAVDLGADIIEPPTDMPYGQRRMLLRDPDGTVLDISAPTVPMR